MHMRCLGRGLGSNFRVHVIEYCENINLSPSYYADTSSCVLVEDHLIKLSQIKEYENTFKTFYYYSCSI